jgi:hypothetical protein
MRIGLYKNYAKIIFQQIKRALEYLGKVVESAKDQLFYSISCTKKKVCWASCLKFA